MYSTLNVANVAKKSFLLLSLAVLLLYCILVLSPEARADLSSGSVGALGPFKVIVGDRVNPALAVSSYRLPNGVSVKIVRINLALTSVTLHPGRLEPGGGPWGVKSYLGRSSLGGIVAAFNSGFKLKDSGGGFYENGRLVGKLVPGVASFIIHSDGGVSIAPWPKGGVIRRDVVSIRQNIKPLMLGGVFAKNIDQNLYYAWGGTLTPNYHVWRSGVAIDGFGNLIYAIGNNLTPLDLAKALRAAGGVNAMELDINAGWTDFYYYTHSKVGGLLVSHKITDFIPPARLYFSTRDRDFFSVSLKGLPPGL